MALFELHITLFNLEANQLDSFVVFCEQHALKPIIVGVAYSTGFRRFVQTSRYVSGTYAVAFDTLLADAQKLSDVGGFKIARRKIEAVASTLKNPLDFVQVGCVTQGYYETHIVFALTEPYLKNPQQPYDDNNEYVMNSELQQVVLCNAAFYNGKSFFVPLSFNLKKSQLHECFLTLRHYADSFATVSADENRTVQALAAIKHVKTIREFVCFDDNPSVDAEFKPELKNLN